MLIPSDDQMPSLRHLPVAELDTGTLPPFIDPSQVDAPFRCGKIPCPETLMHYIAIEKARGAWGYHVREVQFRKINLLLSSGVANLIDS